MQNLAFQSEPFLLLKHFLKKRFDGINGHDIIESCPMSTTSYGFCSIFVFCHNNNKLKRTDLINNLKFVFDYFTSMHLLMTVTGLEPRTT